MERRDQLEQRRAVEGRECRPIPLKGKQVYVEGRLQTRSYDDKDGKKVWKTDVVAEDVILLSGQGRDSEGPPDFGGRGKNWVASSPPPANFKSYGIAQR